jgi:YaiO family outer membrane protein
MEPRKFVRFTIVFAMLGICLAASGQRNSDPDGLFLSARHAAFHDKDYARAKSFLYAALETAPDYSDVRIFLGRIHTWAHEYDSARSCFQYVLQRHPDDEEAAVAFTDLEYWQDHLDSAMMVCRRGLDRHPDSRDLLIREAKIYRDTRQFQSAGSVAAAILRIDRHNTAARSLLDEIRELSSRNKLAMSYDFTYFDRQFDAPWHLVSLEYGRATKAGAVTARINGADRFDRSGIQYEIDAYPHISKIFYSYAEIAWSPNEGIFPQWHGGFSLYANLHGAWEGELGLRYLQFSGSPTWIYTGCLGKYYLNWLFSARVYLTPATTSPDVSASYSLSARYYYGGADEFLGLSAGYGISPDDRYNLIQLSSKTSLVSYNLGVQGKKKIGHDQVLSASLTWLNQEYLPGRNGNQYDLGLSWLYRF